MLYDPKWEQKTDTKADPFKLATLIAWLEKQPAAKVYCYENNGECLLSQYFLACGFQNVHVFTNCFYHGREPIPGSMGRDKLVDTGKATFFPASFNGVARTIPRSFGAALDRARAYA